MDTSITSETTVIRPDNAYILKLPQELRIEILKYAVRQGDIIEMKDGTISRKRRRWDAKIETLKDPN